MGGMDRVSRCSAIVGGTEVWGLVSGTAEAVGLKLAKQIVPELPIIGAVGAAWEIARKDTLSALKSFAQSALSRGFPAAADA